MMKITKISIIGAGKMGSALIRSFCEDCQVYVFDISKLATSSLITELKDQILVANNISSILASTEPLILAVKPSQIQEIIKQVPNNRLIISIAAGVTLQQMDSWRIDEGPIIRVMSNIPIQIGMGMSCIMGNSFVDQETMNLVQNLFAKNGETLILKDEAIFHTITALSGSGPAFVYLFLQSLEDTGVYLGLDRESARKLILQTTLGSVNLAKRARKSPQDLIHDITSPGGTTVEALASLKKNGFEHALHIAIKKAAKRSKKMI